MKETQIYRNVTFLGEVNVNNQFTFPTSAGATGQVLTYSGSGVATWTNPGALSLTTDDVIEGVSLYFTQERAEDVIGNLIQDGTGLTWNYDDGANLMTGNVTLAPFSTIDLAEGATALYYTDERVDDRVSNLMVGGTGINFIYDDIANTLTASIDFGTLSTDEISEGTTNLYFTNERVDDRVASLLQNGTGISWNYNDGAGLLTPTVSLAPFTTSALAEGATALYFTNERVDDRVSNLIVDSSTVKWTYDDGLNTLSAEASSLLHVQDAGATASSRTRINFIEGSGASITVTDDGVNERANVTIGISTSSVLFEESIGANSTIRKSVGATATGSYNTVFGGANNSSTGAYHSIIVGGSGNSTSVPPFGTILNGSNNDNSGYFSTILGGEDNNILSSSYATIIGGLGNTAESGSNYSTVSGSYNVLSGSDYSTVVGTNNTLNALHSTVFGNTNLTWSGGSHIFIKGANNTAKSQYSTILNGQGNTANDAFNVILNGDSNETNGNYSLVQGFQNLTQGNYTTILNGNNNDNLGNYSTIIGNDNNITLNGDYSFVNGLGNTASQPYTTTIGSYNVAGHTGANIIGSNITSNAENTTFVNNFNIVDSPTENNTEDSVLVRNNTTGQIETRDAGTLSGVSVLEGSGETVSSGTGVETSLRTITIPANTLRTDGSAITVQLGGGFGSDSGSQDFRIKFNGNQVYAKNFTGRTTTLEFDAKLVITRWNSGFIKAYTTMNMNGETTEVVSYIEFSLDLVNNAYTIDITGESVATSQVSIFSSLTTAMVV